VQNGFMGDGSSIGWWVAGALLLVIGIALVWDRTKR
jgi:hypothetical protein